VPILVIHFEGVFAKDIVDGVVSLPMFEKAMERCGVGIDVETAVNGIVYFVECTAGGEEKDFLHG